MFRNLVESSEFAEVFLGGSVIGFGRYFFGGILSYCYKFSIGTNQGIPSWDGAHESTGTKMISIFVNMPIKNFKFFKITIINKGKFSLSQRNLSHSLIIP